METEHSKLVLFFFHVLIDCCLSHAHAIVSFVLLCVIGLKSFHTHLATCAAGDNPAETQSDACSVLELHRRDCNRFNWMSLTDSAA